MPISIEALATQHPKAVVPALVLIIPFALLGIAAAIVTSLFLLGTSIRSGCFWTAARLFCCLPLTPPTELEDTDIEFNAMPTYAYGHLDLEGRPGFTLIEPQIGRI